MDVIFVPAWNERHLLVSYGKAKESIFLNFIILNFEFIIRIFAFGIENRNSK